MTTKDRLVHEPLHSIYALYLFRLLNAAGRFAIAVLLSATRINEIGENYFSLEIRRVYHCNFCNCKELQRIMSVSVYSFYWVSCDIRRRNGEESSDSRWSIIDNKRTTHK